MDILKQSSKRSMMFLSWQSTSSSRPNTDLPMPGVPVKVTVTWSFAQSSVIMFGKRSR